MKERNQLRFYRRLLMGIFLIVEAYVLGLNLYYRLADHDAWGSVAFNFLTSTALTAFVIGMAYYFLWRTLTSLQESESRYRELSEKLQQSNAELELYANTVSHDLKGPIANVVVSVQSMKNVLEKPPTPENLEAARELADIALTSATKSGVFIEELLTLAETGRPRQLTDLDVSDQVKAILRDNEEEIKRTARTVTVDGDLGRVRATQVEVYQVFSNLIINAITHGGPDIEVRMLSSNDENTYLVRDNGPGVPEKILDQVFDPFVKGEGGSTGIGLAIVAKIVNSYGCETKACNDSGACFEFSLKSAGRSSPSSD